MTTIDTTATTLQRTAGQISYWATELGKAPDKDRALQAIEQLQAMGLALTAHLAVMTHPDYEWEIPAINALAAQVQHPTSIFGRIVQDLRRRGCRPRSQIETALEGALTAVIDDHPLADVQRGFYTGLITAYLDLHDSTTTDTSPDWIEQLTGLAPDIELTADILDD